MLKKIRNTSITIAIVSVVSAALIYGIEYFEDSSIEYYGSVPVAAEYHDNALIEGMTFGKTFNLIGDTITFHNVLMCHPLDHILRDYFPIQDRVRTYEGLTFGNDLTGIAEVGNGRQISYSDALNIRKHHMENPDSFVTWFLDDIRPDFNAECYIESDATTYTTIFNLPKTTHYKGITFKYFIE